MLQDVVALPRRILRTQVFILPSFPEKRQEKWGLFANGSLLIK